MLQPVFDFLERLITQFTWKRLALVALLMVSVVIGFTLYELYTGHFTLGKLAQSTELLDKLTKQHDEVARTNNKDLVEIHQSLTKTLKEQSGGLNLAFDLPEWVLKAMAMFAPWLFVIIIVLLADRSGIRNTLAGFFLIVTPIVGIGAILPTWEPWWINFVAIPLGVCITGGFLLTLYGNRTKK